MIGPLFVHILHDNHSKKIFTYLIIFNLCLCSTHVIPSMVQQECRGRIREMWQKITKNLTLSAKDAVYVVVKIDYIAEGALIGRCVKGRFSVKPLLSIQKPL